MKLRQLIQEQEAVEKAIKSSEEYLSLMDELEDAEDALKEIKVKELEMLAESLEKQNEIADIKKEMIKNKDFDPSVLKPKYKANNLVDVIAFRRVIDDEDRFMSLISVTQAVVKAQAKECEGDREELLGCIIEGEPTLTDLLIK